MSAVPWAQLVPIAVIGVVVALRLRGLSRPRPLRPLAMWLIPALLVVMAAGVLIGHPPDGLGWLALAGALGLGAMLGWQRGRFTRMERDPASGRVMLRQSPAAIMLLVAVIGLRWALRDAIGGATAGEIGAGHQPGPAVWLLTEAMLGFGLGFLGLFRLEIMLRARRLPA